MSIIDEPTPEEQAAAAALAEAIDGPDVPAGVDPEALGVATLLAAHDRLELSDARLQAVASRIGAQLGAPEPRRSRKWLLVAAPALAAVGLAFVALPSLMMTAHEPAPAAAEQAATKVRVPSGVAPAPVAAPTVALPAPAALIELQARVLEGDSAAEFEYDAALSAHRTRLLSAMGGER